MDDKFKLLFEQIGLPFLRENEDLIFENLQKNGNFESIFGQWLKTIFTDSRSQFILGDELFLEINNNIDLLISKALKDKEIKNKLLELSEKILN